MKRTRILIPALALIAFGLLTSFQMKKAASTDPLIDGYKATTAASVADAVDQVVGQRGFMSHTMKMRAGGKMVGRAVTALVRPATPDKATPTLATKHSVELIEAAKPGEVGVIVMENGLDVAAFGDMMATAAKARDMAGMVADGGVRDIAIVRSLGLNVYSTSVTPSTAVGRYASVSRNEEVTCAGIKVRPGDIIVGNEDGVVVVPQEKAADVLKRAQEIDKREAEMVPFIKKFKSLAKAIAQFNRI